MMLHISLFPLRLVQIFAFYRMGTISLSFRWSTCPTSTLVVTHESAHSRFREFVSPVGHTSFTSSLCESVLRFIAIYSHTSSVSARFSFFSVFTETAARIKIKERPLNLIAKPTRILLRTSSRSQSHVLTSFSLIQNYNPSSLSAVDTCLNFSVTHGNHDYWVKKDSLVQCIRQELFFVLVCFQVETSFHESAIHV